MSSYDPTAELEPAQRAALVAERAQKRAWHEIEPRDAANLTLPSDAIWGPLTEYGGECPWPWEPQQFIGVPLGQYRCKFCNAMCVAGVPHSDYTPGWDDDCASVLIDGMAGQGVEVSASTEPPLVRGPYTEDPFVCPHGIRYWLEPTGEQIAQWAADGVR